MTTWYVEGSPLGPSSHTTEAEARRFAQSAASRFKVQTTLHSSATGHTGIRRGVQYHDEGKTLARFYPQVQHQLWAVIKPLDWKGNPVPSGKRTGPSYRREMILLGSYQSYDEALAAWQLADSRRRAGRSRIGIASTQYAYVNAAEQELEYLAVRTDDDADWAGRYPVVPAGRWTALLAGVGSSVRVRIYGNTYRGTVVRVRKTTADVTFSTRDRTRTASFPILPASPFARGVHA